MEEIARYIFEAGMLKRTARSGWWAEKVTHPESVADHAYRTGIIAFVLARMEGKDDESAWKLCSAAVFHDMHETRLGDMNRITARYITVDRDLERSVWEEQLQEMPDYVQSSIMRMFDLSNEEMAILKDADHLECAFQAKEYADIGYSGAKSWIENTGKRLVSKSAKMLHKQLGEQHSNSWWKGLKKV